MTGLDTENFIHRIVKTLQDWGQSKITLIARSGSIAVMVILL